MPALTYSEPSHRVDNWLKSVVANVLEKADLVRIERSELWSLLDNLPVAILISTDRECARIVGNIAAGALLNAPLGSNLSQSAPDAERPQFKVYADGELVQPADLPMQRAAATGRRVGHSECEIRFADGRRIFIAGHCIPIVDENGVTSGSIGAFVDVTERHLRQERDDLVAREMTHRVKNTVSLVQALAHSTIRNKLSEEDYEAFADRLINMAQAQELIAKAHTERIMLEGLVRTAMQAVAGDQMARVELSGPDVEISSDLVQPLAMVFHELTTNACKYGALGHAGKITIEWSSFEKAVALSWIETGVTAPTDGVGFGSKLIRSILRNQAMGKFTRVFGSDGLTIRLSFIA